MSCITPLTRKAMSCLYSQKTKLEEHIVSDLFGYSGPNVKRRMGHSIIEGPGFKCKMGLTGLHDSLASVFSFFIVKLSRVYL